MTPIPQVSVALLIMIGLAAGVLSGIFGIGGGLIIVPALIYLGHFSQHQATGTSIAILLPPVGIAAVYEYYRHGNVSVRAALIVAGGLLIGGGIGALLANRISGPHLRLAFGVFVTTMGVYLIYGAVRRLGWI